MSVQLDDALLALRRTQVGAAMGALKAPEGPIEAFFGTFPGALIATCYVGSAVGFPYLRLGTFAASDDAFERLRGLIVKGLDGPPKQAGLIEALAQALGASTFNVHLQIGLDGSVGLEVGLPVETNPMAALDLLTRCRVEASAVDALSDRLLAAGSRRITELSIEFPKIDGPPRFWLQANLAVPSADKSAFFAAQARLLSQIGASQAQANWHKGLADFCTPRPENQIGVRLGTDFQAPIDEVWFHYPLVRAGLVLKLISQFAPEDHAGLKVAALSTAAGVVDESVQSLWLGAWKGEPPRVAFGWTSPGIQGMGDA